MKKDGDHISVEISFPKLMILTGIDTSGIDACLCIKKNLKIIKIKKKIKN